MFPPSRFEINQPVPEIPNEQGELAPSVPLYQLAEQAPDVPEGVNLDKVYFAFSNDESAPYYDQTQSRAMLPEYRQTTNRTAVIVGEGSLMAALHFIPEDTIILLDKSPEMCAYMKRYVDTLREAETIDDWGELMGFRGGDNGAGGVAGTLRALQELESQIIEWFDTGYEHPMGNEKIYAEARALAREKAIIPWQGDLDSRNDMKRLAKALNANDANVTMINLTNAVASPTVAVENAARRAKRLGHLPVTPHAPILATSYHTKPLATAMSSGSIVEPVGPFYGLENLANYGETLLPEDDISDAEEELAAIAVLSALINGVASDFPNGAAPQEDINIFALGPGGAEKIDLSTLPPEIRAIVKNNLGL